MADSQIQLPYTATTSGDLLDASLLGTKKRERMAIGSDTSTDMAIVSTDGALSIAGPVTITSGTVTLSSNPTVNVSSGVITIGGILVTPAVAPVDAITAAYMPITTSGGGLVTVTNPIGVSSGLITLTGTNIVTNASSGFVQVYQSTSPWSIAGTVVSASSGLIQISGPVTSASSGLVQVLQSTGVWAVSGTVTVGNPSTGVNIFGSSGAITPATSSGGLLVTFTNSVAGSTAINLVGSSNAIAPATSSGGLLVTFTNSVAGSTVVSLSSPIGISSGIITLTSGVILTSATLVGVIGTSGGQAVVTTSGGMLVTFTNSVSGSTNTMISGSTGSIGVVTSGGALFVGIVSSGGIYAPVTSSAGLLVNASITGGAGSTVVSIEGAAGIQAPVTTSMGLQVRTNSTDILLGILTASAGAPVTQSLTTAALWLYSVTFATTAGTAGNAFAIHSATSALSSNTGVLRLTNASAISLAQVNFNRGIYFANGLQLTDSVTFGTTGTNTAGVTMSFEYQV